MGTMSLLGVYPTAIWPSLVLPSILKSRNSGSSLVLMPTKYEQAAPLQPDGIEAVSRHWALEGWGGGE